jgi:hypothetical protein
MPITPYGHRFDPEDKRVLGVAFEMVCIALRVGDCDDGVKRAIAAKIIDLANAGERNPDILCEQALQDIRSPPTFRPHGKKSPAEAGLSRALYHSEECSHGSGCIDKLPASASIEKPAAQMLGGTLAGL